MVCLSGSGGTVINIRGVLEDILRCQEQGVAYVPMQNCPRMGPQPILGVDSSEAQIIADCVKDGMSTSLTLLLVNKHGNRENSFDLICCERHDQAAFSQILHHQEI
jgi:hypothetical protein